MHKKQLITPYLSTNSQWIGIKEGYDVFLKTSKIITMSKERSLNGHAIPQIELQYNIKAKVSSLPIINNSWDAYGIFIATWAKEKIQFVEQFKVMLLNRSNRVLGICTISTGSVVSTIADPKLIFALALKANACAIIIAHNHPSESLIPSDNDKTLTTKIKQAGNILELKLMDHLIVTNEEYYSFADEGML
jgi:DNA repair protein RadC